MNKPSSQFVRTVATVKIQADSELEYLIINRSDFDEKKHKLYVEKPTVAKKKNASKD